MFDTWSKPKFYTKCKSALRHVMTRLEQVKKRRLAVEKFMKTDIADLIKGGLDHKAYLKADMLLVEQKITVCYDLVEQFCSCILGHLSDMVKQSECPEESREAAASLVYAAARFADLPELRQLRSLFIGRYGNSLEAFANKELVDKLKANPSSKDSKLSLMQGIAQEFSVDWDSKALEQKLFTPPQPEQVLPLHNSPQLPTVDTNRSSLNNTMHKNKVPKSDTPACYELTENIVKLHVKEDNEAITEPRRVIGTEQVNQKQTSSTSGGYRSLPPPYTKPKSISSEEPSNNVDAEEKKPVEWDSKALEQKLFTPPQPHKETQLPTVDTNHSLNNTLHKNRRDTPACNEPTENIVKLHIKEDNEAITEPRRVSGTEQVNQKQTSSTSGGYRLLPPPYTRPKPTTSEEPSANVDAEGKKPCSVVPKARSVRTRGRRSLNPGDHTNHQGDEEERVVDRLLQHYSKKNSNQEETWRRHRATKSMSVAGESSDRSERKGHGRASSVDMGRHVHRSLPEYDGLAARVAALRGI